MGKAYQVITDRIVKLLEEGTVPWHRPWGGPENHPRNLSSGKGYRGINVFMLSSAGYDSPYWVSFKQAKDRGGNVKRGETGYPCIFWNWMKREDKNTGEELKVPFLKYYTVFNAEQCEGFSYPKVEPPKNTFSPILGCERVVGEMPNAPKILRQGNAAFYRPLTDAVSIPRPEMFESPESYYSTLFHRLAHSTGHKSRLGRNGIVKPQRFGSHEYSKEELVGEMGAAYLCGHTGIENKVIDNSASYISSWLSRLKNDNRLVVQAAAQAQKASDYILNKKKEVNEESN